MINETITKEDREAALKEMSFMTDAYKDEFMQGLHDDDPRTLSFIRARRAAQSSKALEMRDVLEELKQSTGEEYWHACTALSHAPDAVLCKLASLMGHGDERHVRDALHGRWK